MIQETSPNRAVLMQPFSSGEEEFSYKLHGCKLSCDIKKEKKKNPYPTDISHKIPAAVSRFKILESLWKDELSQKRPLRLSSPTVNLALPSPPLHHVPKHHIYTSFKYLQGWGLHHFPGQPVPMLDNPFSEVKFPNIQSKPPLAQLEAISSHPITCYLGEETDPTSLQPPFRQL
ncbi:hypothetical protein QYF61_018686 [Mycteria americana]|uniref:Uncharacterized protein n=1 Tax=Mycteria americana TaxID=33587 RepID=A0AAN7NM33_MYCAM|nr:hypothetical protein QYF61_018686 [Mycteria americana]